MPARTNTRHYARESALALLYASDITDAEIARIIEEGSYPTDNFELPEYAEELLQGVAEYRESIDTRLIETSDNWALDRMPVVDRAILRLATYEMLYEDDVPVSVTIDEAVELAKTYGGEDESHRFVNGVLGRIARQIEGEGRIETGQAEESLTDESQFGANQIETGQIQESKIEEGAEGAGYDGQD